MTWVLLVMAVGWLALAMWSKNDNHMLICNLWLVGYWIVCAIERSAT